jgi:hypothetical protein
VNGERERESAKESVRSEENPASINIYLLAQAVGLRRERSLKLEKQKIERKLRETSSSMDHVHVLSGINQV